jgi:RNA polymerase sigma-70 factor (ECF subfamily)
MAGQPSLQPRLPVSDAYIPASSHDGNGDVRDLAEARRRVEAAFVARAKEGDRDAFGELYVRIRPAVYRLAWFHAGDVAAEDIVAETFLRAWNSLPRHRDTGAPFSAWIYGIARHIAIDEVRRNGRSEPRADLPDRGFFEPMDDRLALADAMERLPDVHRQVLEMKYMIGLTNLEIAAALGITTGAVNAKRYRALKSLRDLLDDGSAR